MIGAVCFGLTLMLIFVLWFARRAEGGFNHGVTLRIGTGPGRYVVHNPKWWMLWAHVRWLMVLFQKRERGIITMTKLEDGVLQTHHLRVYRCIPSRSDGPSE